MVDEGGFAGGWAEEGVGLMVDTCCCGSLSTVLCD